ncbi:MAG: hypothetical protein HKP27_06460, partial [Myxococcales bacterium]|nr:hypothetical protein [Myxococcales bacterium]
MQPIFIGDIQGCADELEALLSRAKRSFGNRCEFWFAGDLVNRGPDNLRVLSRVRELHDRGRAHCVLGNHDLHFLAGYWGLRQPGPLDTLHELLDRKDVADWADWLRRLPVAIAGKLSKRPFLLVHAGVHPRWSLQDVRQRARKIGKRLGGKEREAQVFLRETPAPDSLRDDLARMTNGRSVSGDSWSKEEPGGDWQPWHRPWRRLKHDYGIVYGHWSTQGLHVKRALRGIDTGCVHHGRFGDRALTAWLPDLRRADPFALPD